jgi:hypothetical protein
LAQTFAQVLGRHNATYCDYARVISENMQKLLTSEALRSQIVAITSSPDGTLLGVSPFNAFLLKLFGLREKLQAAGLSAVERAALLFLASRRKLHARAFHHVSRSVWGQQ